MDVFKNLIEDNGLIVAFLFVGVVMFITHWLSRVTTNNRIPGVAMAIAAALVLAYFGGENGIADFPMLAGMALLGGSMMRDFAIVATAMGASFSELKKTGMAGIISLLVGVTVTFFVGGAIGYSMGYTDAISFTTIGGRCLHLYCRTHHRGGNRRVVRFDRYQHCDWSNENNFCDHHYAHCG